MKKILIFAILIALFTSMPIAGAEDLGVQLIGGPDTKNIPLSLDDLQLAQKYIIDGYAIIEPIEYLETDCFAQFIKDANYKKIFWNSDAQKSHVFVDSLNNNWYYNIRWSDAQWMDTGLNADFAWFMMDITNLQKKDVEYTSNATVKIIYQDEYEFAGWIRQVNYDYINQGNEGRNICRLKYDKNMKIPNVVVLDPANVEPISMMYKGTFVFGATLPNSVFEDTASSLRMIITIDGNELTYNIRK